MKKVMQNKSLLHRLIALTMAVVMTLTLVAIDSHFHLFAEEEDIQTIDVTAIVKGDKADMGYGFKDFDKAIKFKIKSDKVDGIDSSKLGVAVYKGATADDKIATATDAAGKLVTFDNVYELKNDTAVQKIAIYYYTGTDESGDFELLGTIKVAVDKQAPTISVEADDNYNLHNKVSDGYYLLNLTSSDADRTFVIDAKDTTDAAEENATGIDYVEYSSDNGKTWSKTESTSQFVAPDKSGTYKFRAVDVAGNKSEETSVIVKKLNEAPVITSVTPEIIQKNGVDYRFPQLKVDDAYKFTVQVKKVTAGSDNTEIDDVSLYYKLTGAASAVECTGKKAVSGGYEYEFEISAQWFKKDNADNAKKLVIYAKENEFGNNSVGADEDGDIVFVKEGKPELTVTGGSTSYVKSTKLTVKATGEYSYIDTVSYSVDGKKETILEKGNKFTYSSDVRVSGGDVQDSTKSDIYLADGEHTITFAAKDFAGIDGRIETVVKVDNTAPVVKVTDNAGTDRTNNDQQYTVTDAKEAVLNIKYSDATSGVASAVASLKKADANGSYTSVKNWYSTSTGDNGLQSGKEISIDGSGSYVLTVVVTDEAGNKTETNTYVYVNVDGLSGEKLSANGTDADNGAIFWRNDDTLTVEGAVSGFQLAADDAKLVITRTSFAGKKDKAVEVKGTVAAAYDKNTVNISYELPDEGVYEISLMARIHDPNNADTKFKEVQSIKVYYDKTAPANVKLECANQKYKSGSTFYYRSKSDVKIKVSGSDNDDSNGKVTYTVGRSSTAGSQDITGSINVSGNDIEKTLDAKALGITDENTEYTMTVKLKDRAGNESKASQEIHLIVDTVKPSVSIDGTAGGKLINYWNNSNVTITARGTDNYFVEKFVVTGTRDGKSISKYELDADYTANAAKSTTFREPGLYNITIVAVDEVGNESGKATTSFVIDKKSPEISVVSGGSSRFLNRSRTITFGIEDDYGMDTQNATLKVYYKTYSDSNWSETTVPFQTADGKNTAAYKMTAKGGKATVYYFTVEGADNSGNALKPAADEAFGVQEGTSALKTKNYYVDTTEPLVYVDDDPEYRLDNNNYFKTSISFRVGVEEQFKSLQNTIITENDGKVAVDENPQYFYIKSNGGTWGKKYTYDKEGEYDLTMTVTDKCGNEGTTGTHFYIDKHKPEIQLGNVNTINNRDVTVPVTLTDNMRGGKYTIHVVRTNEGGSVVENRDIRKNVTWGTKGDGVSTVREVLSGVTFDAQGDYTVTVSAEDKAGNKAVTRTVKFRIDKTAPVISISGMNDRQTTAVNATISIDEAFSFAYENNNLAADAFNVTITRKTDGTAASNIATLGTSSFSGSNPHTATYNFTEDGEYTITANARDLAGNVAASQTKTFKVDSKAPVVKVSAVDKDNKEVKNYDPIGSMDSSAPNYVDMSLSVQESFFSTDDVKITVKKDSKDVSSSYFTNYSNSSEFSTGSQRFSEDGVYEVSITAQDELGNKADDYSLVFTVDNTPPELKATSTLAGFMSKSIASDDGTLLLNASDFADIRDKGYEALWDVSDTSDFSVDAKIDGVNLIDFSDMTDGYHKITLTVTDKVGHTATQEFDYTYDGTAPRIIITGVEDGETLREPFNMTIGLENEEDEITSIVINGNTIDPASYQADNKYEMQVDQYDTYTVEVTAQDKAGNIATTYDRETGEVFTFKLSEKMSPVVLIIIIIAAILLLALLAFIIIAGRRRKKNAAA